MYTPKVSIVIPVYNGGNYLKEAIDSALNQTYNNCEVIVVNDGSDDNLITENICLSYNNKIRYYLKENGGVASAVNFGISKMTGNYFSWLSHDDIYCPTKVERQIDELRKCDDKTKIVHSNYELENTINNKITKVQQNEIFDTDQLENSVFPILFNTIHGSTVLIHISHFNRIGLFNESLFSTQDYDLFFRLMRKRKSLFVKESLVRVRLHHEATRNTSSSFKKSYSEQFIGFLNELTTDEFLSMKIHPICFYYRIAGIARIRDCDKRSFEILKKIRNLPCSSPSDNEFIDILKKLLPHEFNHIYIFGAGFHGKLLNHELKGRNVYVSGFIDNDLSNRGKNVDNVKCYSISDLSDFKNEILILISPEACDEITDQLSSAGFRNVLLKKELERYFISNIPNHYEVIENEMEK